MPKRLIVIALAAASSLALVFLALDLTATESDPAHARRANVGAGLSADPPVAPPALAAEEKQEPEVALPDDRETRAAAPEADVHAEDLAEAQRVEGRVIFPADTPADEKAVVVASGPDFDHGPENRVEVPSDGSFRIAFPKGTIQGTLRVEARYLYLEELVRVDLRKRSSLYLLEPRLGGRIEGVAHDDLGQPLETFEVEALSMKERSSHIEHFSRFGGEAVRRSFQGTGGRFEFEKLTPGPWSIAAKAPGHVASEGRVLQVAGGLAESIEIVVPRAGRIEGRVVDRTGRGVSNARVVVGERDLWFFPGERENSVTTDDAGRFVLAEVVPGAVAFHAESELDAPSETLVVELEPGELVTGIELSLRRGGRITGRVVDAPGSGIPGRGVSLYGESTGRVGEATSDAAGQFAFENLAAGRYYLLSIATPEEIAQFAHPESQEVFSILSRRARVELEELGSADVILAPPVLLPVRLHGRVTSSGQPLANAEIRAPCPPGFTSILADAEGLYELALPSPGSYSIWVDCEGTGMQFTVEVDVPAVERFAFDIEIASGAISGSVADPDGRPVAGVLVIGRLEGESRWKASGETTTHADGSFRLEVPAGTHDVAAGVRKPWDRVGGPFAPDWVRGIAVAPGQRISGISLRLERGGAIEGRIEIEDGGSLGRTWVRVADGEGWDAGQTMADAAGSFRIEGVAAGRMRVQAFDQEERVSPSTPIEVRADETSRVDLLLSKGTDLQVRVVGASGALIEVEAVELLGPEGEVIQSGSRQEDGSYGLGTVPAGKHVVRARHLGRIFEQQVNATGGGELTVDLFVE